MNIEKLKSIIRLANNNPSEAEANLAARKACKILAENDFSLLKTNRTAADKLNQHASNYGTWGGVNRSAEPAWSSKQQSPSEEARRYQEDWFKKYAGMWESRVYDPIYDEVKDAYSYDGGKTWKSTKTKYQWNGAEPKKKESQDRVCSKCGLKVSTYRHKEEPFVCSVCHWKDKL